MLLDGGVQDSLPVGDSSTCTNCQKRLMQGPSSLTQWIFGHDHYCMCQENTWCFQPEETAPAVAIVECNNCSREIRRADGSMTQWIFRSRYCSCVAPSPRSVSTGTANGDATGTPVRLSESPLAGFENIGDESITGWREELIRYTPLKKLGEGGSGSVFLCEDTHLNKLVAVKFLRWITPKAVVSFQMEAKVASKLVHSGIVRIIDFGTTDSSVPYMVMEPIAGFNLKDHIAAHGALTEFQVRQMATKLCRSLAYAHKSGTLHRDIKTSNIILEEDFTLNPVLIDFGIARLKEQDSTVSEKLIGSPEYMPPDTVLQKNYSEASEIYSLGCVLFEALTGQLPFQGSTALETLSMHISATAPALSETRSDLTFSPEIERIVSRCLEKDPALRFQSMVDLETELCEAPEFDLELEDITQFETRIQTAIQTKLPAFLVTLFLLLVSVIAFATITIIADRFKEEDTIQASSNQPSTQSKGLPEKRSKNTARFRHSRPLNKVPPLKKVRMISAWRMTSSYLPARATQLLISNQGMVATSGWATLRFITAKHTDEAFLEDPTNKKFMRVPLNQIHLMVPAQFRSLEECIIRRQGSAMFAGHNCEIYKCFDKNRKLVAEFWATKQLEMPPLVKSFWCQAYGMPEGYGVPVRMRRSEALLLRELKSNKQSGPNHLARSSLPPAVNGWIQQDITKIEQVMTKNTDFEIPSDYEEASNRMSMIGFDEDWLLGV